jgi:glucose-6-phosphate 1-dehydrogenase
MDEHNHAASGAPAGTPHPGDPCVMVIFGASGDLTKRKLIPAIYNLAKDHVLAKSFAIVGFAHDPYTTDEFRGLLDKEIKEFAPEAIDADVWNSIASRIEYLSGDFGDEQSFVKLKEAVEKADQAQGAHGNYLYYLATAPDFFATIVKQLGAAGLTDESKGWRRVIIEKPFGRDYESARKLNADIREVLKEKQIYRIDHYLGKETVQNIMVFRFANGIFEPVWNRRYVDHVQITVSETVGVEQRGGYYDHTGTLRDMIPNHIFQLITLTAMEPPVSFDADAVRDEQTKILKAIQPILPEDVLHRAVRGQYAEGELNDEKLPGYREEPHVATDSRTETYVALKLFIDNWRWAEVPFYVRTGKRMPKRVTEIVIQFRRAPFVLFRKTSVEGLRPNRLVLHLQPDEGISLRFGVKIPGAVVKMGDVDMAFHYEDYFGATPSTGYERLLYDAMLGDATLFQRSDMVETSWSVVAPIQDVWSALPPRTFPNYAAGSWGPHEADELLERDGRHWSTCDSKNSGC